MVIANSADICAFIDEAGVITDVSRAWAIYGGTPAAEVKPLEVGVGVNWIEMSDRLADEDPLSSRIAVALRRGASGTPDRGVVVPCLSEETMEWYELTVVPGEHDGTTGAFVTLDLVRRPDGPTPPNLDASHGLLGSACDPGLVPAGERFPEHTSCPGWWPHPEQEEGWVCACPCHENSLGWPAWSAAAH